MTGGWSQTTAFQAMPTTTSFGHAFYVLVLCLLLQHPNNVHPHVIPAMLLSRNPGVVFKLESKSKSESQSQMKHLDP
jgi:hypothetical protein